MAVTTGNIIVGAGILKVGDVGVTEPNMRDVGGTKDGVEFSCDRSYYDISSDQIGATIAKKETNRKFMVKCNLQEATLQNLALIWAMPLSAITAGTMKLGVSSTPEKSLIFLSQLIGSNRRKATFYKAVSVGSGGHSYKKDGEVLYPVEFEVIADTTQSAGQEFGTVVDSTADVTAPTVTASTPASGATAVVVSANLTVTFSEAIDIAAAYAGFTIEKVSDGSITVNQDNSVLSFVEATKVMTINPNASLAAATQYRLRVRNVGDLEGNKLTEYAILFTTA